MVAVTAVGLRGEGGAAVEGNQRSSQTAGINRSALGTVDGYVARRGERFADGVLAILGQCHGDALDGSAVGCCLHSFSNVLAALHGDVHVDGQLLERSRHGDVGGGHGELVLAYGHFCIAGILHGQRLQLVALIGSGSQCDGHAFGSCTWRS